MSAQWQFVGFVLVTGLCLLCLAVGFFLGEANAKVNEIIEEFRPEPQRTDTAVIDWNSAPAEWWA